ncbi:Hint domain-containing protein [Methylobacterium aquaticum]|uniref:Hint domain-containing protein n=1 Tax=Methylobacterium aquaticum TaxID=270351 RepID=UPI001931F740|nr:Hint domain-containing protein [Methylobacterium aquaticum]QRE72881.1 Hint domain-containing protein [Methylobacterium aquaticum]
MAGAPLYDAEQYKYSFNGSLPNISGGGSINISGYYSLNYDKKSNFAFTGPSVFTVGEYSFGNSSSTNLIRNIDGSLEYRTTFFGTSQFGNETVSTTFTSPVSGRFLSTFDTAQFTKSVIDYNTIPATTNVSTFGSKSLAVTSVLVEEAPCFVTGARIRTTRGDIAVEDLKVGDRALTVSGAARPIVWIGHRDLAARDGVLPHDLRPIRVGADAFGPNLPARDLRLSPGHPVLVGADADGAGGHLVPIMCLINGTSITREPVASVTYWHVELDAHDILLAEGLPAESYLDWGDRPFFTEASDHALHNPDFVVPGLAGRCRPVAVDGPVVEAERARLSARFGVMLAAQCAWDEAERFAWLAA